VCRQHWACSACCCGAPQQSHVCSQLRLKDHNARSSKCAPLLRAQARTEHLQASLDSSEAQVAIMQQERDALAGRLNQACIHFAAA